MTDEGIFVVHAGLLVGFEITAVHQSFEAIWTVYVDFIRPESRVSAWHEVQPAEFGFLVLDYSFDFSY